MADCPVPWKPPYPNPQKAYTATRRNPSQEPYHCTCGAWHLSTAHKDRNLAASSKAGYRDKWKARRTRRKIWGGRPAKPDA